MSHTPTIPTQIVVGVLLKSVGLGWRPRLFVLQDGVLKYYKVYGPTAVNVAQLLDTLRQSGELFPVGAEVVVLERQHASRHPSHSFAGATGSISNAGPINSGISTSSTTTTTTTNAAAAAARGPSPTRLPPARMEVHMQVGTVRESSADGRKLYVHSGTTTLTLRAETQDDRWVWAHALRAAKGAWDGLSPMAAGALLDRNNNINKPTPTAVTATSTTTTIAPEYAQIAQQHANRIREVKNILQQAGAGPEAAAAVVGVLEQYHQDYARLAETEEAKRHALLDVVYTLQNDKRQLETALIVESQQQQHVATGGGGGRGRRDVKDDSSLRGGKGTSATTSMSTATTPRRVPAPASGDGESTTDQLSVTGDGDDEEEEEDEEEGEEGRRRQREEESEEDEFFECEALSLHSRSNSLENLLALESNFDGLAVSGGGGGGGGVSPVGGVSPSGGPSPLSMAVTTASKQSPQPPVDRQQLTEQQQQQQHTNEKSWVVAEGAPPPRRDRLPPPQQREKTISLWSLIKEMVGKDLTRVCLPVYFNEPLSALEKTAEELEYSELLDAAAQEAPGSVDRMLKIVAFAVSAYSSTLGRTAKPFNPLLGETYELVHVEKGFRFLAEKVSHHPTIIAATAEGRGWRMDADADVKSRFWGRSIELKPEGVLRLTFDDGEVFAWNKVTTSINNLILGKIYVDHGGIMRIRSFTPGGAQGRLVARVRFKETSMLFDKDPRQVRGFVEEDGVRLERPIIHGHWDASLYAELPDNTSVELWKKHPPPPDPTRYNLTKFAIQLNELTPGLGEKAAPTDCRRRPDQAFTEQGMWDEANAEKQRLEHKQRAARKAAEAGEPLEPRWFEVLPTAEVPVRLRDPNELAFKYKGGYWEAREARRWDGCRDIFGPMQHEHQQ